MYRRLYKRCTDKVYGFIETDELKESEVVQALYGQGIRRGDTYLRLCEGEAWAQV